MKKYFSIIRVFIVTLVVFLTGCVHDDEYGTPDVSHLCQNEAYFTDPANKFVKWTIHDLKLKTQNVTFTDNAYVEGYVSSTDASGNIYKYIYIQDAPVNPSEGLIISVDAVSTYADYPMGSKVYIKLKGLSLGSYHAAKQLGYNLKDPVTGAVAFSRIPENMVSACIFRSCTEKATIVPKVMTLADMKPTNDQYIGCLIKVPNAEFDAKALCSNYSISGENIDKQINDPTTSSSSRLVRNSGYASFANQKLPAGKGDFIGILSIYDTKYQLYINEASDLSDMTHFPRKDGVTSDPCSFNSTGLTLKTIAEVKQLYNNTNYQFTQDIYLKAQVTANDETKNLYRYIYVQDATGGIRINMNKANTIYLDSRFKVGKNIYIKLKDLYIGKYNGEFQIGIQSGTSIGFTPEENIYKYLFDSNEPLTSVIAEEKTIPQITFADVGKWIKIKNVQFSDTELGNSFSGNRTIEDCSGNKITLKTNSNATFSGKTVEASNGDIYAIISYNIDSYQLIIPYQYNADFDNPRCDGTIPIVEKFFSDGFNNLANWTAVNILGTQVWGVSNQGTGTNYYAVMSGNGNEDWLISKKIAIPASTYKEVFFSFETEGRSSNNGNPLEVYVTDNYTGTVSTTTWTKMTVNLDTDLANFAGFVNSGKIDVSSFKGKDLVVAFKYTSTTSASTTWELDNFAVKGIK